jgi:uncharacterized protein (TIRG00374 family)
LSDRITLPEEPASEPLAGASRTHPPAPAAATRKRWVSWLRLGLGLGLLAIAVGSADPGAVWQTLLSLDGWLALAALALYVGDRALMAYKWDVLLRARSIGIGFLTALRLYLVSGLISTVTPGGIGGDVYRVVALSGFRAKTAVAATVVVERLLGVVVMGLFTLATLPAAAGYFGLTSSAAAWTVVALVAGSLGAFLLPLRPGAAEWLWQRVPLLRMERIRAKLDLFLAAYRQPGAHSGTAAFVALTVLDLLVMIAVDLVAARALGITAPWLFFVVTTPAIQFLGRLPVTVGGLGVQEGLYVLALVQAGFPPEAGVAFALFRRVIPLCVAQLPAALLLWLRPMPALPVGRPAP